MSHPDFSLLGDDDLHLFNEGRHFRLWEKLGSHPTTAPDGTEGTFFAVWAPNAASVSVVGDWNHWRPEAHPLRARGGARRSRCRRLAVVPIPSVG